MAAMTENGPGGLDVHDDLSTCQYKDWYTVATNFEGMTEPGNTQDDKEEMETSDGCRPGQV